MDAHHRGRILELSLGARARRERGRHFTAPRVASAMAGFVVGDGGGRVLDPACGAGALLEAVRAGGAGELVGVDAVGEALDAARATLGGSTRWIHGDFLSLDAGELGGPFDAVVANPPYLRQERIPRAQKRALRARFSEELGGAGGGRVDLLGYFLLELTRHLRPGGRLAFLSSAAWLTSRYGAAIRTFFARRYRIEEVIESAVEPWFPEARIRAALVLARRARGDADGGHVHFVRLTEPLGVVARRGRSVPATELAAGTPWGVYLRTPSALGEPQRAREAAFVPLGDLVEARFGLKTGADRFFLFRDGVNGLGQRWPGPSDRLRPIVVGPAELDRLEVDPQRLPRRVLVARPRDAEDPGIAALLAVAEAPPHSLHHRATCRARERRDGSSRWFTVPPGPEGEILWTRTVQYRHLVPANRRGALINNNLIALRPKPGVELGPLLSSLNSGWTFLERFARGRVSNEGKVKTEVGDLATLLVPDPARLTGIVLGGLARRPVGRLEEELTLADRLEFEGRILRALGFSGPEAARWLTALVEAVTTLTGQERTWERAYWDGRRAGKERS